MSAEGQIKAFIDRILRLKEEQDVIGDDIRDIYAEAKGMGFDKTAMGNVVAHLRKVAKKGSETVAEQGAIFDIYLAAYEGGHTPAPARVRENIEKFDPLTGEFLDDNVDPKLVQTIAMGVQTEIGRKALVAAVNVMIEREEAEEAPLADIRAEGREVGTAASLRDPVANVEEGATSTTAAASSDPASRADDESERQHSSTVGFADDCRTGGKEQSDASAAPVGDAAAYAHGIPALSEKATVAAQDEATVSHSDQREPTGNRAGGMSAGANEGGENVDRSATRAGLEGGPVNLEPSGPEAERATSFTAKPPSPLRPHCRQPEACGGYGRNHCHTCAKAMREREPAEELA
ncbi:GapR family DNA-binding domain-containing protein [Sinorhizobium sp. GL28]|uniref:DUF2312 domain-containing protein n=1 Tax=Sinorhizobium sp. GL28 TaxID=1358418 RepID=UPI00071DF8EB|nr:GapR family DNA-binding domain-containing protein [Sinorhizobium sp. GL28]KSV95406.1 hypothetical protein N184_00235 [Sinorhizobium sp. GL28]